MSPERPQTKKEQPALLYHFVEHARSCMICGKAFVVGGGRSRWNKKTCGPACARAKIDRINQEWHRARPGSHSIRVLGAERVCAVCGRTFTVAHPSAWGRKVCSAACQAEFRRRNIKAWIRSQGDDFPRKTYQRKKELARGEAPSRLGPRRREGFCLGCGGKTRFVPPGKRRSAKDRDTLHWHRLCLQRFTYRWTKGLFTGMGEERACSVCGRTFLSLQFGGFVQKACSEDCRIEQRLRSMKAWQRRHPEQLAAWREANQERTNALQRARRRMRRPRALRGHPPQRARAGSASRFFKKKRRR